MRNQFKKLLIVTLALALIGVPQFLVCVAIAMLNYPGGYSFRENFLSDLGEMGYHYHALFNGSLIVLGITLIPAFLMLSIVNIHRSFSMKVTTTMGVLSALGLIGLGLSPFDRELVGHYVSLGLWLFPMLYMTISFFYSASKSPYVGIGFIAASLVMVVVMIAVLLNTEVSSQQMLQKIIVVCGLVWLIYVLSFLGQAGLYLLKHWDIPVDHTREEEHYYATIKHGGRRG